MFKLIKKSLIVIVFAQIILLTTTFSCSDPDGSGGAASSPLLFGALPKDAENRVLSFLGPRLIKKISITNKAHKRHYTAVAWLMENFSDREHEPSSDLYHQLGRCEKLGINVKLTISRDAGDDLVGVSELISVIEHCACVTSLKIKSCKMLSRHIGKFLEHPRLQRLTSLSLIFCDLSHDAVAIIAGSSLMRRLRCLNLHASSVTDRGVQELADSKNLITLRRLNLSWNNITVEGARALANSIYMQNITSLVLAGNPIGHEGILAIATTERLENLIRLHVGGYPEVNIDTARAFVASPLMRRLAFLKLDIEDEKKRYPDDPALIAIEKLYKREDCVKIWND